MIPDHVLNKCVDGLLADVAKLEAKPKPETFEERWENVWKRVAEVEGKHAAKKRDDQTCPKCGEMMEFNPADPCYGADADGNRSISVPAFYACDCGHTEDVESDRD